MYFQVFHLLFLQIFQALRLFFLPNFSGSTFISCPSSIPDSRVGIKKGLYNVEAREWDSLMYDGNSYWVMQRLSSIWAFLKEEPGASRDLALWCSISDLDPKETLKKCKYFML